MIAGGRGRIDGADQTLDKVFLYNIDTKVYKDIEPLPYVLAYFPLVLKDNIIYAFGGKTNNDVATDKVLTIKIEKIQTEKFEIYNQTLHRTIFNHFVMPYN